jgi:hypothetical protein
MERERRDNISDEALKASPKTSESKFSRFSWVVAVLLAILLGGVGLFYVTWNQAKQAPTVPIAQILTALYCSQKQGLGYLPSQSPYNANLRHKF